MTTRPTCATKLTSAPLRGLINDALKPLNFSVPVLPGSIRGFAVSTEVKKNHPERFEKLVAAFKELVEDDGVKKFLKGNQIGAEWTGPEKTQQMLNDNFNIYNEYKGLMSKK